MLQACFGSSEVLLGIYVTPRLGRKLLISQKYTQVGIKTCKIDVCQMEEFHGLVF